MRFGSDGKNFTCAQASCCKGQFGGCVGLESAPSLPPKTLNPQPAEVTLHAYIPLCVSREGYVIPLESCLSVKIISSGSTLKIRTDCKVYRQSRTAAMTISTTCTSSCKDLSCGSTCFAVSREKLINSLELPWFPFDEPYRS